MVRPLVRYGGAGLDRPAEPVRAFDDRVAELVRDMTDTMYAAPGIGLAAPQIGVPLRVALVDLSVGKQPGALVTLINPELVERSGLQVDDEGCLSVPGFTASVARPAHVVVRALDAEGRPHTVDGTGLLARALQHELDHLNGLLFLDRLRQIRRAWILSGVKRLQQRGSW
jgi:peptide deformylase